MARLRQLEGAGSASGSKSRASDKDFDFAAYPKRKIALKFCYSGWDYGGLAFQEGHTVLPTVENVLFDALARTKLVDPAKGFEGCGWERCGRTDRGVSSAGQVVSLWVRSALEQPDGPSYLPPERSTVTVAPDPTTADSQDAGVAEDDPGTLFATGTPADSPAVPSRRRPELQYVSMLNRVLPMTIRILAWSPVSADFSSRFACKYRHYKYFFTSHGLDVGRMRDGARRLLGEHDFRNLCKLDPAKQITSFKRRILRAEISSVDGRPSDQETGEDLYVFDLVGTAFLYNQVRHIVAILFLIGTGLEHPSVITSLVNADPNNPYPAFQEGEPVPEVVDTKPEYQMADPLPLMLWECAYDDKDVSWRVTNGDSDSNEEQKAGPNGSSNVIHQLHSIHTRSRIYTAMNAQFLSAAQRYVSPPPSVLPLSRTGIDPTSHNSLLDIPLGGGTYRHTTKYIPLLQRKRLEHVDIVNQRWREGKGLRREARKLLVDPDADE